MPTINFKGKNAIWNHHLSVPYQILEKDEKLSIKGKNEDENLIIEADNLIALKSLLPKYQGKIKCIYIDPPYNTGNEGWIYNDKSNSPLIKEWFHKVVDKEDLTKHDKWLCMMTPRLKLLKELMAEDGVMFISIDNKEQPHLKLLCDEIFGYDSIETYIWNTSDFTESSFTKTASNTVRFEHEYIIACYKSKDKKLLRYKEFRFSDREDFSNPDNDKRGDWMSGNISRNGIKSTTGEKYYTITTPKGSAYTRNWTVSEKEFEDLSKDNRIYFSKEGEGVPRLKIFKNEVSSSIQSSIFTGLKTSITGKNQIKELFDGVELFSFPKPSTLIKRLIEISTKSNDIVLDSFAGTGTTAQAVMELNAESTEENKENRKFILVQLPEETKEGSPARNAGFKYIHEITRERVKRVIKKEKFDVGFSYVKLGPQIDAESILSGKLPSYGEFSKYVYYLATGKTMEKEKDIEEDIYFVGKNGNESIYLIYEKDMEKLKDLAITLNWAEKTNKKDKNRKIVYAPACFLDDEYLEKYNISFVSIPYSLFEKK